MKPATKEEINQIYPRFKSQADGVDYVRDGLENHEGEFITVQSAPEYFKELMVLMECHPNFAHKFVDVEIVQFMPLFNEREQVYILDIKAKTGHMDVSWKRCAQNLVRLQKGQIIDSQLVWRRAVLRAMRLAIQDEMNDFRKQELRKHRGKLIDAITGKRLAYRDAVVDHFPWSFSQIADEWLDMIGGIGEVKIAGQQNFRGMVMSDKTQVVSWRVYHTKRAFYRIISAKENEREGAHGYKAHN